MADAGERSASTDGAATGPSARRRLSEHRQRAYATPPGMVAGRAEAHHAAYHQPPSETSCATPRMP